MRHGVVALNQFTTTNINGDADGFAWFWRATSYQLRSVDISFATLLSIGDTQLTDFGTIVSGNVEQPTITNLSSHFSVARRLIENDIDFTCLISRQHSLDDRFGLQKLEAEKF